MSSPADVYAADLLQHARKSSGGSGSVGGGTASGGAVAPFPHYTGGMKSSRKVKVWSPIDRMLFDRRAKAAATRLPPIPDVGDAVFFLSFAFRCKACVLDHSFKEVSRPLSQETNESKSFRTVGSQTAPQEKAERLSDLLADRKKLRQKLSDLKVVFESW